jgi:pyruvate dehydrogenase E1 component alpha subunit
MKRDPLLVVADRLRELGVADSDVAAAADHAASTVAAAIETAKAAPEPDPAEAFTDVWADGGAAWRN